MTDPIMRVDVFPARAELVRPDGTSTVYVASRVIITQDEAYVFMDTPTGPQAILQGRLDAFEGRNTIGYTATLADESVLTFKRGGGCGCGSRLRGFQPFKSMMQGQVVE